MNNTMQILMQMFMSGGNPNSIVQNIIGSNPQAQVLINQIQQSGLSPIDYLKQYATQNNINLGPYANLLNSKGIKL